MRKRRIGKYVGLTLGCTVICVAVFLALQANQVFGKFVSQEPYVEGMPETASVVVTSEGGTQQGSVGTGASPCPATEGLPKVPTAEGIKGSETNPFVLLEVVPDKAMQQWTYLSGSVESGMPEKLDAMAIGIKVSDKAYKNDHAKRFTNEKNLGNYPFASEYGQWFINDQYEVYKIGSKSQKEKMPFVELAQLYTISISAKNLENQEQFEADYQANKNDIGKLFDKYPELFAKDDNGETIRDIAKADSKNWEIDNKKHVIQEEKGNDLSTGYLVAVEPGKGDYGYASEEDFDGRDIEGVGYRRILTKTGTDKDRWVYVKTQEELQERFPGAKNWISGSNFWNNDLGIGWSDLKNYLEGSEITGLYTSVAGSWPTYRITETPEKSEQLYTFKYYGLKNNEILKRALFVFKNQEEFENFHMQVICMTPAELNELSKKDTDETLDMIERADMFSFQTYSAGGGSDVNDMKFLCNLYHKEILGEENYEYDADKVTLFYENDLEWDLCSKIILRESENKNLPLIFNQMVGMMIEKGVTQSSEYETHMFVTEGIPNVAESVQTDVPAKGSLNNISKMYLISIQFDLLARQKKDGLDRTFMEHIFPYIKKISLPKAEGAVKNTATTTGYFDNRPLCTCTAWTQEQKERSYYLWNLYTFFPTHLQVNIHAAGSDKDIYVKNGYLPTFFATNANPFRDAGSAAHQRGSDGMDDKNVGVTGGSVADTNHSGLLSNKGDGGGVASNTFETAFQIMNGQADNVENLTVTVLKQKKWYEKISDNAVLIDYSSLAKYKEDKTLYLKVKVGNTNNQTGIIKSIKLTNINGTGAPITVNIQETTDISTVIKRDKVKNSQGDSSWNGSVDGYGVDANGTLTFIIPYSLYDWQKGYNTVELVTQAHMYNEKKERFVTGQPQTHEIAISERTLFNLE
ncbi:MAG: hypothetical protein J1F02_07170 [Lachnospiraceae bacterium]|nr:hypothetical protein [Lachnospiraceae bacterium]